MTFAKSLTSLVLFLSLGTASFFQPSLRAAVAPPSGLRTITNPVLSSGGDPWVTSHEGFFYYCAARGGGVSVGKSKELPDIGSNLKRVFKPEPNLAYSRDLWAPELHFFQGRWFIYVAADNGKNENHRMYVLRSKTKDAQGEYEMMGELDTGGFWAIDGHPFSWKGKLYFVWSGWEGKQNVAQNLYIAPMSNPWTVSGQRVAISKPELPWELKGGRPLINEGPTSLIRDGRLFIVYSASGSWSNYYCLGRLDFKGGNILDPKNWKKQPEAAFLGTQQVIAPGHASFVNARNRDWIVYHSARYPGAGWKRDVRMQPFTWKRDGSPYFGKPLPAGELMRY
ncbi:glycosyl hydrolase family 43 [bacterium]|nr:MAG: glycosyl hydrolase family 43 [bacterium]